jgi:hypothetical protein
MAYEDAQARAADDKRAHDARVKLREQQNKAAVEELDKQHADMVKSNAQASKRMEESQPTPTQKENDLARLGVPVLEKEDDGSGPDRVPNPGMSPEDRRRWEEENEKRRRAEADGDKAAYRTRTATPAKSDNK